MQAHSLSRYRTWAAMASVAGLVFVAGWGLSRVLASDSTVPAPAMEPLGDESMEARVARLEARLERIDLSLARLSSAPRDRNGPEHRGAGLAQMQGSSPIEDSILQKKTLSEYEQLFRNQSRTSQWGQDTTIQLTNNIDSEDILAVTSALPESFNLDCRSDMCRMTFSFSESSDASQWSGAYLATLGQSVGRIWSTEITRTDGSTDIVMYGFK
ncbi:hypothetical protein [Luteimonas lutimaris]|uniref:hypothetical protein n=1 Tax=Luteimonas lutimaris TaxID=698645 RepID=UPI0031DBA323